MGHWLDELTPNEYVASVYDIDLDKLWIAGKQVLLIDLDNTLVPWRHGGAPSQALLAWSRTAHERGFRVCIVSNGNGERVAAFARALGIPALGAAGKPRRTAFRRALTLIGGVPSEAVMIGDQLFTDVRGGNRSGLYTILVLPVARREWWGTRCMRLLERWAWAGMSRRGLAPPVPDNAPSKALGDAIGGSYGSNKVQRLRRRSSD